MINDNIRNKRKKNNKAKPTPRYASQYPARLQGLPSNSYGGTNLRHQVGFRGSSYGKASPVYVYSPDEIIEYANDNDLTVAPSVLEKAKRNAKSS